MQQNTLPSRPDKAIFPGAGSTVQSAAQSMLDGFTSHVQKAGAINMHYVEGGSGKIVLLLHGWPATWRVWRKVMPELAKHYHVVAIDLPGLGDSEPSQAGYDKASIAQLIHTLLHASWPQRIYLVGHDIGAAVAYAYARQFPEDVEKLVVMDDPLPGLKDWDTVREKWPRWHFAFHSLPNLPEQLVSGKEYIYLSWFYHNAYQKAAISEEDISLYVAKYANPSSLHAGFEYYRAFERDALDNASNKPLLKMPILAIGGEHSAWKSILYEQLQDHASSLQGAVVPACGHFIPEEQPEWVIEQLLQFFALSHT
ncbi:alpha/beta hydrolase [Ktedonosporobacter rubrisoli]|uniref:Alpha/beta hydrolase n=1 Tax=Ktedonosporobacter rubrisoli TaxID=2509675 RepID=A0A4P6JWS7_KTERU|nr:alpha/beta hydrolase [Ktedonosporobacter rubrisoli]QBD80169.1 alpha/beta hydrolase [Ktedonosporobacter rubrisoli]